MKAAALPALLLLVEWLGLQGAAQGLLQHHHHRQPALRATSSRGDGGLCSTAAGGGGDGCFSAAPIANFHHHSIKTNDIERSMKFYSLFGLTEACRFKSGGARAVFLEGCGGRLELVEVPEYMKAPLKATDLSLPSEITTLGLNHVALDITGCPGVTPGSGGLSKWLSELNERSEKMFDRSIRLVHPPMQRMMHHLVYEVAFIADDSGTLIELLHFLKSLPQEMEPDW